MSNHIKELKDIQKDLADALRQAKIAREGWAAYSKGNGRGKEVAAEVLRENAQTLLTHAQHYYDLVASVTGTGLQLDLDEEAKP